jgi:hypothetical protein
MIPPQVAPSYEHTTVSGIRPKNPRLGLGGIERRVDSSTLRSPSSRRVVANNVQRLDVDDIISNR